MRKVSEARAEASPTKKQSATSALNRIVIFTTLFLREIGYAVHPPKGQIAWSAQVAGHAKVAADVLDFANFERQHSARCSPQNSKP
jgi:hypothetical protein